MHETLEVHRALAAMRCSDDLEEVLRHVERLHGHLCPHLSLGVKAGYHSRKIMSGKRGGEDLLAVVECNNCFAVGVQLVTGCTFGNNSLIFKDLGQNAVTMARRRDGQAVRLAVRANYCDHLFARYPEVKKLYQQVVIENRGEPADILHLQEKWHNIAKEELRVPMAEQFTITRLTLALPRVQDLCLAMAKHF